MVNLTNLCIEQGILVGIVKLCKKPPMHVVLLHSNGACRIIKINKHTHPYKQTTSTNIPLLGSCDRAS